LPVGKIASEYPKLDNRLPRPDLTTLAGIGNLVKKSLHELTAECSGSQAVDHEFSILVQQNANGFVDLDLARRLADLAEVANPPSNNMGGNLHFPPYFISHGEKKLLEVVNKSKIDWLAFTSLADVEALKLVVQVIWPDMSFSRNSHGMPGYAESLSMILDGVQYGMIGFGAKHGRNFVSLTGTACKTLNDELIEVFHGALSLPEIKADLSRLDLCFDMFRGERTFDHAVWAYSNGAFKRRAGSSTPEQKIVGTTKDGSNLGRTMYVGKRGGHVMARVYEKGLEVFARLPEDQRMMSEAREALTGAPEAHTFVADDWLRLEVEYRRQGKDILLPLDMMLRRDEFFAGAYPYFADALGVADGVRPAGIKSEFQVDLEAMISHGKRSYGTLIHSLKSLGFTDSDVVQYMTADRHNNKLVKSGLLARMRQAVNEVSSLDPDFDIPF
jgi:DNA relaxase NicK